jgi:hypothetical protein
MDLYRGGDDPTPPPELQATRLRRAASSSRRHRLLHARVRHLCFPRHNPGMGASIGTLGMKGGATEGRRRDRRLD